MFAQADNNGYERVILDHLVDLAKYVMMNESMNKPTFVWWMDFALRSRDTKDP